MACDVDTNKRNLEDFDFRFGENGRQAASTMMLDDIANICNQVGADAHRSSVSMCRFNTMEQLDGEHRFE